MAVRTLRMDKEIGATGISVYGGNHWNVEDYNPALHNQAGMKIYDKMRSSDGEIAASLARITLPLISAEWRIDPAKTENEADQAKADEIAAFVREVLIERTSPSTSVHADTFGDFIRHALLMLPFGFMAFEKVWGIDEKGRQVIAKLAPRLPTTFWKFEFHGTDGAFSGAVQRAYSPATGTFQVVELPAEKLLLIVFGREGDNYWGRSILRPSYKHWDFKDTILWVEAAAIERYGMGAMEIHATDSVTDDEKAAAELSAKEFRSGERQYIFTPQKFAVTFHHPPSGQSRGVDFANYNDQQIARSMMSEFMATGTAQTGSRAVVASKVDLLMLALKGTGNIIEDAVNRQVIVELVDRNFGVQEDYPTLKCEDLDKMIGPVFAEIMKPLVDARLVVPDEPLRAYVRKIHDLPEEDPATADPGLPPQPFGNPNQPNGNQPNGNAPPEPKPAAPPPGKSAPKQEPKAKAAQYVPRGLAREPFAHERYAAFSEYQKYLDLEPKRIWARVAKGFKDRIILDLADQASKASDSRLSKGNFDVRLQSRFADEMAAALMRVYLRGRQSVVDERARALAGKPYYPQPMAAQDPSGDMGVEPDITPTDAQGKWVKSIAAGFVGALILSMKKVASKAGLGARNVDPTPAASDQAATIAAALYDLSEAVQEADLGGAVNVSYINGRDEQMTEMQGDIEEEFYSAVLDANTCEPCASLDGESQSPGDNNFTAPNPDCEGGDRCRCVTIAVWRGAAA